MHIKIRADFQKVTETISVPFFSVEINDAGDGTCV